MVVTGCHRRAPELDVALAPIRLLVPGAVHDAHLVAVQRWPSGGQAERGLAGAGDRPGLSVSRQNLTVHGVHGSATGRWDGQPHGRFGEPVDRHQRLPAQAVTAEAFVETAQCGRADRFGPVERQAPAGEVQMGEVLVGRSPQAQLIAEIG